MQGCQVTHPDNTRGTLLERPAHDKLDTAQQGRLTIQNDESLTQAAGDEHTSNRSHAGEYNWQNDNEDRDDKRSHLQITLICIVDDAFLGVELPLQFHSSMINSWLEVRVLCVNHQLHICLVNPANQPCLLFILAQ